MLRSSAKSKGKIVHKIKSMVTRSANVNDNHSDIATQTKKRLNVERKKPSDNTKTKRIKRSDLTSEDEDQFSEPNEPLETVRFQEDDNVVEIGMSDDKSDFPSKTEVLSDDFSDHEEGEVRETDDEEDPPSTSQATKSPVRKVIKRSSCRSVEDQVEELSSTVKVMQDMMREKGILEEFQKGTSLDKRNKEKEKRKSQKGKPNDSVSDTTIYEEAVEHDKSYDNEIGQNTELVVDTDISFKLNGKQTKGCESSLSEDQIDTSDELMDVDNFIADCAKQARDQRFYDKQNDCQDREKGVSQADRMIRDSEAAKARMMATPGNTEFLNPQFNLHQAALVDEKYVVIGGNVEEYLQNKIVNHEYVNFAKLLPKDRMSSEEDHRMELVCKGGMTFFCSSVRQRNGWFC